MTYKNTEQRDAVIITTRLLLLSAILIKKEIFLYAIFSSIILLRLPVRRKTA